MESKYSQAATQQFSKSRDSHSSLTKHEGAANNKLLDEEDIQRGNLNSKYVSLTLVLKILIFDLFFCVLYL